ncbi:hypothetical protein CN138_09130 [Sinorhizobium meliloti]|uniref:hypothetical protein n=1 Tax=Rhizobium meliloti TaxID=382 RepID=UPI000FD43EAC|nr:hypothetical protein [Sinorhizobium meliloti]RVL48482.1 hypothetical protein CN145_23255 [Sinorhizobium meliloti]RVL72415.1 hypothetical protein CN138_09130 [Sinorhizobium meliloti]
MDSVDETARLAHIYPLKFWTDYEDGEGDELRPVDWVTWVKKGTQNGNETTDKVARVKRDDMKWGALKPYYEAWKSKTEAPVNGYPLDAWPGVTAEQARVLKERHVRSVEDLVNSSDADLIKIGLPGIRQIHGRAKAFLEARVSTAPVAKEVAQLREENRVMREELEAAMALLKEATNKPDAPRRGRPPKDDAE